MRQGRRRLTTVSGRPDPPPMLAPATPTPSRRDPDLSGATPPAPPHGPEHATGTDRDDHTEWQDRAGRSYGAEGADRAGRRERADGAGLAGRVDRAERRDGADVGDRVERRGRADGADGAERSDRAEHHDGDGGADRVGLRERAGGPDRVGGAGRADSPERTDGAARPERADGVDHRGPVGRSGPTGSVGPAARVGHAGRPGGREHRDDPGGTGGTGGADRADCADCADRVERHERAGCEWPPRSAAPPPGAAALAVALAERTADLQRLKAEYDNYRSRVHRDRLAVREAAVGNVLRRFLPVLDAIAEAARQGELTGGFQRVALALDSELAALGLGAFGAVGDPFDPRVHQAVAYHRSALVARAVCSEIVRPGYRVGDQLLRPAEVIVTGPPSTG